MTAIEKLQSLKSQLHEFEIRYNLSREGYVFDFNTDIAPFLKQSENILYLLSDTTFDSRYTKNIKNTIQNEWLELSMSCHEKRFSKKLFIEKYKYIKMWLNHIEEEQLISDD